MDNKEIKELIKNKIKDQKQEFQRKITSFMYLKDEMPSKRILRKKGLKYL